ncbi:tetratricopeptide repeat protein [uncultured Psychrosphaera sp.]|uniref:tetratricopeptide repeat protein n=1 Tax=uncultured Psychrosphaera sp. TaxID=1403522 RepID=UPI00261EF022|nr:tetratricopeptide repeat protein [uncultured Psychrosphaera sp.]
MKLITTLLVFVFILTGCAGSENRSYNSSQILQIKSQARYAKKAELIAQAEQGDITAMLDLNKDYLFPETKEGLEYFHKWYDLVLKSDSPEDIEAFRVLFVKYESMFINGRKKYLALLEKSASFAPEFDGNKNALINLYGYFLQFYEYKKRKAVESKILLNADKNDYLSLFEINLDYSEFLAAEDIYNKVKTEQLVSSDELQLMMFKIYTSKKQKFKAKELLTQIIKLGNEDIKSEALAYAKQYRYPRYPFKFNSKSFDINDRETKSYREKTREYYTFYFSSDRELYNQKLEALSKKEMLLNTQGATEKLLTLYKKNNEREKFLSLQAQILELDLIQPLTELSKYYYDNRQEFRAYDALNKLAEEGNSAAMYRLVMAYIDETDFEQPALINKWRKFVFDSNNIVLKTKIIEDLTDDPELLKELPDSFRQKLLQELDKNQHIPTLRQLSSYEADTADQAGYKYLEMAANAGDVKSMYKLARKKLSYSSAEKDVETAMNIYQQLIDRGEIRALNNIAKFYIDPPEINKNLQDVEKGFELHKKASDLGDEEATKTLYLAYSCSGEDCIYFDSAGETKDIKKSIIYLERLANLYGYGDDGVYSNLGIAYQYGYGPVKNLDKALVYYNKITNKDAKANYYVGLVYEEQQDYEQAIKYFTIVLGFPSDTNSKRYKQDASLRLANIYHYGKGKVPQDIKRAKLHYLQSESPEATSELKKIENTLNLQTKSL